MRIHTFYGLVVVLSTLAGLIPGRAHAFGPDVMPGAFGRGVVAASAEREKTEEELREILERTPGERSALERLALLLLGREDYREAEEIYSRLLEREFAEPALAVRYAVAKWHFRQDYEAQAALIATARNPGAASEDVDSANAVLAEIYDADGLPRMVRESLAEEEPEAARAIEAIWERALRRKALPGASGAFPDIHPFRSFFSLWLGYSLVGRGELEAAKRELKISLEAARDKRTTFYARAGIRLIEGLEENASYFELLNVANQVYLDLPDSAPQLEENPAAVVYSRLDGLEHDIRRGDFAAAAAMVGELHRLPMDAIQKGRYFRQLGELWLGLELPGRAAQAFEAAGALSRESSVASTPNLGESLSALAERYRGEGDTENYLKAAGDYVAAIDEAGDEATAGQKGLASYYRGMISNAQNRPDEAYRSFERASGQLDDKYRLSEVYMLMAENRAARGDVEQAAELAEASLAQLPDEDWKVRQAAEFFARLGMPEKGVALYEDRMNRAETPNARAGALHGLTQFYGHLGRMEEYLRSAGIYCDLTMSPAFDAAAGEKGLAWYYRGEILSAAGDFEQAREAYANASGLLTDNSVLSDVFRNLAEYEADRGDRERAAEFAEKSAETRPEDWVFRRTGDFLMRLDMPEKAFFYYDRSVRASDPDDVSAYAIMADAYRDRNDAAGYSRFATRYIDAIAAKGAGASGAETGLAAYYRGEILTAAGEAAQARLAYENAVGLLTDNILLSDAFRKMAEYEADRGDRERAAEFAEKSAGYRPEDWVYRRTGDFFLWRLNLPEKALAYYELAGGMSGPGDVSAYAVVADASAGIDPARYSRYAGQYIDAVAAKGADATDAERGLAAYYRGKLLTSAGESDEAYRAFESASRLLDDRHKLSETYFLLAERQALLDENERAAELAGESLALLPDEEWKARQVADFYARIGKPEMAEALYRADAERAGDTHRRLIAIREMAELGKRLENRDSYLHYAGVYRDLALSPGFAARADERGLGWYYSGEIQALANNREAARESYLAAAELLSDKAVLSDVFLKLAEYESERGETKTAAAYAVKSATALPEDWVFRRTGEFLLKLDRVEEAVSYYELAARATRPDRPEMAYSLAADAFDALKKPEPYARYARMFIDSVAAKSAADADELALADYYRGRILAEEGEADEAQRRFELASGGLVDKYKLSEVHRLMARYWFERGVRDSALHHAEKALAALPDELWVVGHVAKLCVDLGRPDLGIGHFKEYIARQTRPKTKADGNLGLAELYRELESPWMFARYARLYVDAMTAADESMLTDFERANRCFYAGEIAYAENRHDEAYAYWQASSELFSSANRLSEVARKRADYHGKRTYSDGRYYFGEVGANARWHMREAVRFAEMSAAYLPGEIWRQTDVAGFFENLGMPDKALEYYHRAADIAATPSEKAGVYESLANFHREKGRGNEYLFYAEAYVDAVEQLGKKAAMRERGGRFYFIGEIHERMNRPDEAYAAYENAAKHLLHDKYLLANVYMKMAKRNVERGNRELAAQLALAAVGCLPDRRWTVAAAMDVLADLKLFDKAEEIALAAIEYDPVGNAGLYQSLANIYFNKVGNRKIASGYNTMFIDVLYERNAAGPQPVLREHADELWYARGAQNGIDRTWGFESYFSGTRWDTGDYWAGMSHQLYREYRLKNGWYGKMFAQYGGTFDSRFTSYHYISEFQTNKYIYSSNLLDTGYLILGATLHPFPRKWLYGFEPWFEYHIPLGRDAKEDFKLGLKYGLGDGDSLKPSGNLWHYWKAEVNTWYSFMDDTPMMGGEIRQGLTYVNDCDRNLLFIPYGILTYGYDGNNDDHPWASDIGLGLVVKKYFREDRHHLPRSNVEVNVNYRWPLTRGRDSFLGVTVSTNF